jgi:drug/metabolite transporter (DMT)-like permease
VRGGAVIAVALGGALIGLAPIGVRLSDIGPLGTNLWRFLFALPILALWAWRSPRVSGRDVGWLLLAGVMFGIELNLWAVAVTKTTVANATLLTNMTPVFAAAFGWLVFKERLGGRVLLGGMAALTGAVVLSLARVQSAAAPASPEAGWLGDGLALASAVGYASYLLILRSLGDRAKVGAVMFWAAITSTLVTLALCVVFRADIWPHSLRGWAVLVGLGVVVQAGGQGLIAYGVGRLPIVVSTVLLWTQPVAAAALSWALFGERLGPTAFVGAVLILAGLYVVQRFRSSGGAAASSAASDTPPSDHRGR